MDLIGAALKIVNFKSYLPSWILHSRWIEEYDDLEAIL